MRFDDETLRRVGRSLPDPALPEPRERELRRALVGAAARTPQRTVRDRRPLALAAVALLAATGAAWWAVGPEAPALEQPRAIAAPAPAPPRGISVVSSAGATFAHDVRSEQGLEEVRLEDGTVRLDVAPLEGRAFALVTRDARIEIEAGRLEASAAQGKLSRVAVLAGRARLARPGRGAVVLEREESWSRAAEPEAPAAEVLGARRRPMARRRAELRPATKPGRSPRASGPARAASTTPEAAPSAPAVATSTSTPGGPPEASRSPRREPGATPSAAAEADAERGFREGWRALEQRDFERAAAAFARADTPGSPVAEEAGYWRAVALMRSGRHAEAQDALLDYSHRYPDSPRAPEIALLLGRLGLARGDGEGARRWLSTAATAEDARIRDRARALLEALPEPAPR